MQTVINHARGVISRLESLPFSDPLLAVRLLIAYVFYSSGRTKAGSEYLVPSEFAIALFEDEYALPIISPEIAAHLALYAETFLPILLVLGLATRASASGLLIMVLVIQVFVYPQHWMEHLPWAVGLVALLISGPGNIAVDRYIRNKFLN